MGNCTSKSAASAAATETTSRSPPPPPTTTTTKPKAETTRQAPQPATPAAAPASNAGATTTAAAANNTSNGGAGGVQFAEGAKTNDGSGASNNNPKSRTSKNPVSISIREKLINIHSVAATKRDSAEESMDDMEATIQELERTMDDPVDPAPHPEDDDANAGPQRFQNVFAQPLQVDSNFTPPVHPKTAEQQAFIEEALQEHFIFATLKKAEHLALVNAMEEHLVKEAGTRIIKQGDIGDYFYICQRGSIEFFVDKQSVGQAGPGASFGELALLYNCPRAATCVSKEADTLLWKVDQQTFRQILASHTIQDDEALKTLVKGVPFLSDLDDEYVQKVVTALTPITFTRNEYIIKKGDAGNVFYIIQRGTVRVTDIVLGNSSYKDQMLGPGESFGERALLMDEPRTANIIVESDEVVALALSREVFTKVLGDYSDLIVKSQDKRLLISMPIFADAHLEFNEIDALVRHVEDMKFPKGRILSVQGEPTLPALYIVHAGSVKIQREGQAEEVITQGGFFGQDYLRPEAGESVDQYLEEDLMIHATMTVELLEESRMGVLTRAGVKSALGNEVFKMKLSRRHLQTDGAASGAADAAAAAAKAGREDRLAQVSMHDLKKHRILGVGTFGRVWLVTIKNDEAQEPYALKIQKKRDLIRHHQVSGVMREKKVMAQLDHPFIIKLVSTYQDDGNLYMLMQLIQGGELFNVIHNNKRVVDGLPEEQARFYGAAVLEGLNYMHKRNILYRDLKPENVLMGKDGYPVLVDLGFAKVVMDKTYTLCGTPLYLAPEVILNRGHNKAADHWSLAVLIFEMITGDTPFYERGIDQMALFQKIVHGQYWMPERGMSTDAKDLIRRLLVTKPNDRLGNLARGVKDIREHAWFASLDFVLLTKKELAAPWKPRVKNPLDCSNFDNWDHLEKKEKNKRDVPVSTREQAMFRGF